MADDLQACCLAAREAYLERIADTVASYPLIREFPCPNCRRIVKVRLWGPAAEADEIG